MKLMSLENKYLEMFEEELNLFAAFNQFTVKKILNIRWEIYDKNLKLFSINRIKDNNNISFSVKISIANDVDSVKNYYQLNKTLDEEIILKAYKNNRITLTGNSFNFLRKFVLLPQGREIHRSRMQLQLMRLLLTRKVILNIIEKSNSLFKISLN